MIWQVSQTNVIANGRCPNKIGDTLPSESAISCVCVTSYDVSRNRDLGALCVSVVCSFGLRFAHHGRRGHGEEPLASA